MKLEDMAAAVKEVFGDILEPERNAFDDRRADLLHFIHEGSLPDGLRQSKIENASWSDDDIWRPLFPGWQPRATANAAKPKYIYAYMMVAHFWGMLVPDEDVSAAIEKGWLNTAQHTLMVPHPRHARRL